MSYTDDAVKAKLSALNETQESIVTVAQWIMFHRRHADRTARVWLQRLKDAGAPKRLNLIYLANEVVQQSKARKKDDFLVAFSPIIVEAAVIAYKGATSEVQQKLRRVIEVWRQRQIFEQLVQETIEARVEELDKSRASAGKKAQLGGSLFSATASDAPAELAPLVPLQLALTRAALTAAPLAAADAVRDPDPAAPVPTPPVHAARLSAALRSLSAAEAAVAASLAARAALVAALDALLAANRTALDADTAQLDALRERKARTEARKREVEDAIMRGLAPGDPLPGDTVDADDPADAEAERPDVERPDVERFTPPPTNGTATAALPDGSTTPPEAPPPSAFRYGAGALDSGAADFLAAHGQLDDETDMETSMPPPTPPPAPQAAHATLLASMVPVKTNARAASGEPVPAKRRKTSMHGEEEIAGFGEGGDGLDGLDEDVVGMLG